MSAQRQDTRLIRMNTPLGKDRLLVSGLAGREALSTLYLFRVKAFSDAGFVDVKSLVGRPVAVSVLAGETDDRHFHGYARQAEHVGYDFAKNLYYYEIEIVPWLWFLTRHTDCRIFQNKSVIDIAKEIFGEFGFNDFEFKILQQHPPREYCVQYRETSFDFISRLFEEEGIFYYFEHKENSHRLIVADSANAHGPVPLQDAFPYRRLETGESAAAISEWREAMRVKAQRAALGDFNFETPQTDLTVGVAGRGETAAARDLELYDYPGGYLKRDDGDRLARLRIEEEEALERVYSGRCNAPPLVPGAWFTLTEHDVAAYNRRYVLISVEHEAENNWDGALEQGAGYVNRFQAIPDGVTFRPPRLTPRPVVEGPQTALVVGPAGEEIFVDSYGRVKAQFHWDRRGSGDDKASCWMRVSQSWAGPQWGVVATPRVGMEVVVEFLEGDPDRPLITGCLYNKDAMPPYALPGEKTRTTIKTRSTPGGGGFNELRFDDKKGAEQIFVHAEKDMDVRIKRDEREWVGASRHLIVGGSQFEQVSRDKHSIVQGDQNHEVEGVLSQWVGVERHEEVGVNYALKAGMEIMLEAGLTFTVKAGGSFIAMGPAGISISGPMVLINSGGAPGSLSASPESALQPAAASSDRAGGKSKGSGRRRLRRASGDRVRAAQIKALRDAATIGAPFCEVCEAAKARALADAARAEAAEEAARAESRASGGGGDPTGQSGGGSNAESDKGEKFEIKGKAGTGYDGRDYRYFGSEKPPSSKFEKKAEVKAGMSGGGALKTFGDDDNYIKVGEAKYGYGLGYEQNLEDGGRFVGAYAEGQIAGVTGQMKGEGLNGLVEGQANFEALSLKGAVKAGYEKTANFEGVKAEAGAEANLVKGSASAQVNITPKTVYDNTLGKAVGILKPEWSQAPKWLDHGVIVGGEVEGGVGLAAKGGAEFNAKNNTFKIGGKIGAGPMFGLNAIFGVK